jgi:hypothetical protein
VGIETVNWYALILIGLGCHMTKTPRVSKKSIKAQSTLWHLRHIQMTLHQHVTDPSISNTARGYLEQASKSISNARLAIEEEAKSSGGITDSYPRR